LFPHQFMFASLHLLSSFGAYVSSFQNLLLSKALFSLWHIFACLPWQFQDC
jgi:hypothetical protein